MSASKRTYSQREKKQTAYNQEASRKRRKESSNDELRLPPNRQSSLLKKPLGHKKSPSKHYGGPVSFPLDDMEVEVDHVRSGHTHNVDVFDKAISGKLKPAKPKTHSIHGSREEFDRAIKEKRCGKKNSHQCKSYLPTPPAETLKQQSDAVDELYHSWPATAKKLAKKTQTPESAPTATSQLFKKVIMAEQRKEPCTRKQYAADATPAPSRDLLGDRLSRKSKEAKLWTKNQETSPFLRLPEDVRKIIYDYTFRSPTLSGGNTIKICFKDYLTTWKGSKILSVKPVFKYHCTVLNTKNNPFAAVPNPGVETTTWYPLLNGVSRQLYEETAHLPYKMNWIAFDSHNIMVNFLLLEKRLSLRQRQAITVLILPNDLPSANVLSYLPNLEKFFLTDSKGQAPQAPRGWYNVQREDGEKPKLVNKHSGRIY